MQVVKFMTEKVKKMKRRSTIRLLSVVSVGFISFLLFGNYVGHSYFNTLSETETHRAVDHIEDELNSYEMFLKNIDKLGLCVDYEKTVRIITSGLF